jgi:pyrrolidone-carboxylate peptidase
MINNDEREVTCQLGKRITHLTEITDVTVFKFKTEKSKNFKSIFNDLSKRYSIAPALKAEQGEGLLRDTEKQKFEEKGFIFVDSVSNNLSRTQSSVVAGISRTLRVFKYNGRFTLIESPYMFLQFKPGILPEVMLSMAASYGLINFIEFIPSSRLYRAEIPEGMDPLALSNELTSLEIIETAEPDFYFFSEKRYIPTDPLYGNQWQLKNNIPGPLNKVGSDVNAENAWNITRGSGVKIGVLDAGFDFSHPDLSSNILISSTSGSASFGPFSLFNNSLINGGINDDNHGTECAGMIGAIEGNGVGVVGIAHQAKLILVTTPDIINFGTGAAALMYIADPRNQIAGANRADGADVLSCSIGENDIPQPTSTVLDSAIEYVVREGRFGRGTPIFWATDNFPNPLNIDQIVCHPKTIAVGRTWRLDKFNSSAFGPELDIVAPGTDVHTTMSPINPNTTGGYGDTTGTSFATPLTAGIGGLILADKYNNTADPSATVIRSNKSLTYAEVKDIIRSTAVPIDLAAGGAITWKDEDGNPLQDANNIFLNTGGKTKLDQVAAANGNTLVVNNAADFKVGQAILVGARTILTENVEPAGVGGEQFITVENTKHFSIGQTINIRRFGSTVLTFPAGLIPANPIPGKIYMQGTYIIVQDTRGFKVGDTVIIGSGATMLTLDITQVVNHTRMLISPNISIKQTVGTPVIIQGRIPDEKVTILGIPNSTQLKVQPLINAHQIDRVTLVEIDGTETRIIKTVNGNTLTTDSLKYTHAINTPVLGGRFPHFSPAYGHGRVDADAAVQAALAYDHNHRDLIIRKHLDDNGVTELNFTKKPIDTPDIWIRNTNPIDSNFSGDPGAIPANYDTPGPHQKPNRGQNKWIYARIKNIGNKLNSLDFGVRFYLHLSDGPPPFKETDFVETSGFQNGIGIKGTMFLDEITVYNEAKYSVPGNSKIIAPKSIAPNGDFIVNVSWPSSSQISFPFSLPNVKAYILVRITPYDGLLAGAEVKNNNNIAFREINLLHDVFFKDETGLKDLKKSITIEAGAPSKLVPFKIVVQDAEPFITEQIEITIRRKLVVGGVEVTEFKYSAGNWVFSNSIPWALMSAPKLTSGGGIASGNQTDITFEGSIELSDQLNKAEIEVKVPGNYSKPDGSSIAIMTTKNHGISIISLPKSNDAATLIKSNGPAFYAFTDFGLVAKQNAADSFGPDSTSPQNKFRLSSSLSALTAGSTVPAYAAVTGTIMIQRNPSDDTLINLILKPLRQSRIGFTPVKYFVYRGILLSDFLKGSSANDEKLLREKLNASEFITHLYKIHEQRSQAGGQDPNAPILSKALGYDPVNQADGAVSIDQYFYQTSPDFQLPVATGGMLLGNFTSEAGKKFAFEIILEEGNYRPTLDYLRADVYHVDVSSLPQGLEEKHKREEILNFIDPAAYYGIHYYIGVETKTGKKMEMEVADLLNVFATCNNVYVDIRSEHGYSLNYYQNYHGTSAPAVLQSQKQISIGTELPHLEAKYYGTHFWPLLIFKESIANPSEQYPIHIGLREDDNQHGLVYVNYGEVSSNSVKDVFIEGTNLMEASGSLSLFTDFTKPISFIVPCREDQDITGNKLPIATVLKCIYARKADYSAVTPAKVIKSTSYLDHVFGPLDAEELFSKPGADIEWVSAQDKKYIDAPAGTPAGEFGYIAERGIAFEQNRVIYYAAAIDHFKRTGTQYTNARGLAGGVSTKGNFFEVAYAFQGLRLNISKLHVPAPIKVLHFTPVPDSGYTPDSILLLGITEAEHTQLKSIGGFSPYHERTIVPEKLSAPNGGEFKDSNNIPYFKYKLKVAGWNLTGEFHTVISSIEVFSIDGLLLGSAAFADLQPIPVEYVPTSEENRALKNSGVIDPLIEKVPTILAAANDFNAALLSVTNDSNAKANLTTNVQSFATDLLTAAQTNAQAASAQQFDDRALYWARLRMIVALKKHPFCMSSSSDREILVSLFEKHSRGYAGINFSNAPAGAKRIVITGFDPYALDTQLDQNNPSGSIALALHGKNLSGNGKSAFIQTAILPVRYRDFDNQSMMSLIISIIQNNSADMVIALGQNQADRYIEIERIAGRLRGGDPDNENVSKNGVLSIGNGAREFYETSLPVAQTVAGPFDDIGNQIWFYDQSYQSKKSNHEHPANGGLNSNVNGFTLASITGAAIKGSAGCYFSNELFYRLAKAKALSNSTVKIGAINVPAPKYTSGPVALSMQDLVIEMEQYIIDSLLVI